MSTSDHEQSSSTLLNETKNSGDVEKGSEGQHLPARDYRKLAICSIICGLSCVGIVSLIYSVKTREFNKKKRSGEPPQKAKEYSGKALKWGIGAILAWVGLILLIPLLLGLLSYLLTFIN